MNRLLVIGLIGVSFCPAALLAQRKEDLQSIQRDVAQLQEQVKELQRSQDEKIGAIQSAVQQAVDASTKLSAGLTTLQHEIDSKLSAQQTQLVAPVASLGSRLDQMGDDLRSVSTNVSDLVRRMNSLDTKLADISSAIRTIGSQPAAPPPSADGSTPGAPAASPASPPAPSADTLWENARRDYSGGNFTLALQEYAQYLHYYPDTDNAPGAAYYIGYIYYNNQQYDSAVEAFQKVLDMPENQKSSDALYYKAVSLMKMDGHRTEAGAAFREFIKKYPHSDHISQAHADLRALGLESRTTAKRRQQQ